MKALFAVLFIQALVVFGMILVALFMQAHDERVAAGKAARVARHARLNEPAVLRPAPARRGKRDTFPYSVAHRRLRAA